MRAAWVIATRELRSFFRLPVGWIVVALFLLLTGGVFAIETLNPGAPASMRTFFGVASLLLMWIVPAVSMRLFSEELRSATIEPLATAPVGDATLVIGKFLGGAMYLICLLVPTTVYPVVLAFVSEPAPDPGPILAGYLSLLLAGSVYLAFGLVASALTSSQTLAYLGTLLGLVGLQLLSTRVADRAPDAIGPWLSRLSIEAPVADLARGVVSTPGIVGLLGGTVWLLCLAYVCIGWRRWR